MDKMIKLMYKKQNEYFWIFIDNKSIFYTDKKQGELWGGPLQFLPPDPKVSEKIMKSRNKIPAVYKDLLIIPKDELEEFEKAKGDEELKQLVMRDCKKNQCELLKVETN